MHTHPRSSPWYLYCFRLWIILVSLSMVLSPRIIMAREGSVPGPKAEYSYPIWMDGFYLNGTAGEVLALANDLHGNLYVGGRFAAAGAAPANNIARWNGVSWEGLGPGLTEPDSVWVSAEVNVIATDSQGFVYAGGNFTMAGDVRVNHIARWNGSHWEPLGDGLDGSVNALVVDESGDLYAGGSFTSVNGIYVNFIAKWDGTNWQALGSGMSSPVFSIAIDRQGNLYAAGAFETAGGKAVKCIARWDGSDWYPVGSEFFGENMVSPVMREITFDPAGNLYAAGTFDSLESVDNIMIAKWDRSEWERLGSPADSGFPKKVESLAIDSQGRLNAAVGDEGISRWNGSSWENYVSAVKYGKENGSIHVISFQDASLIAGGRFTNLAGVNTRFIARQFQGQWEPLGPVDNSVDGQVNALAIDSENGIILGGSFHRAGTINAPAAVARWNGHGWEALGNDLEAEIVTVLELDDEGNLYAGGKFSRSGGAYEYSIEKWDGHQWHTLGSANGPIHALAVDSTGNLYVGGTFTSIGGILVNNIAQWDGNQWYSLGQGVGKDPNDYFLPSVNALEIDGGGVYVGGRFTIAGEKSASNIAYWDGSSWEPLGSGVDDTIKAIESDFNGRLFAGGSFSSAGERWVNHIAVWNGRIWESLGWGVGGDVTSLALDREGNLYVGGNFYGAGYAETENIAKWIGPSWAVLDRGMNNQVNALVIDLEGDLYAGGNFEQAGGFASYYFARLDINQSPQNSDFNRVVDADTILTFSAQDFAGSFEDSDDDSLDHIVITSFPVHGTLKLGDDAVTLFTIIKQSDLNRLVYIPSFGWTGEDSFLWRCSDGDLYADYLARAVITVEKKYFKLYIPNLIR